MQLFKPHFLAVFGLLIFALTSCTGLVQPTPSSPPATAGDDFWQKGALLIAGALLGFLGNWIMDQIKRQREPRRRLSYDLAVQRNLAVEADIKRKLTILYNGERVDDLYVGSCTVINSGNQMVKDQVLRFEFAEAANILESRFDPEPNQEMRAVRITAGNVKPNECKYQIGHFEPKETVRIVFALTCKQSPEGKIYPFNEEGNVEVVSRSIARVADEKAVIARFATLLFFFWAIPPAVAGLLSLGYIGDISAGLTRVIILAIMLPLVRPIASIVGDVTTSLLTSHEFEGITAGDHSLAVRGTMHAEHVFTGDPTFPLVGDETIERFFGRIGIGRQLARSAEGDSEGTGPIREVETARADSATADTT